MNYQNIFNTIKLEAPRIFNFLINDFGFVLSKTKETNEQIELLFSNKLIAVKIYYSVLENGIDVMIYRFIKKRLYDYPLKKLDNNGVTFFYLDTFLSINNPEKIIKQFFSPISTDSNTIIFILTHYAEVIKKYAPILLNNNLRIFKTIEKGLISNLS
jgi:hypothetical protein